MPIQQKPVVAMYPHVKNNGRKHDMTCHAAHAVSSKYPADVATVTLTTCLYNMCCILARNMAFMPQDELDCPSFWTLR